MAAVSLLSLASLARSQMETNAATDREIVVTASRTARARLDAPARVDVIDEQAIRSAPVYNVDDLLRSLDGVSVLHGYGFGYGIPGQINIRGIPSLYGTLALADGFPLNEASSGFVNLDEIPSQLVRQIEVVRGPLSALYGADAFAGVVQLLTLEESGPAFTEAGVRGGNESFGEAWATIRNSVGDVAYVLSADARTIDNYLGRNNIREHQWNPIAQEDVVTAKPAENYDYSDLRIFGKLGADVGASSRLQLVGRLYDGRLGYGQTDMRPFLPSAIDNEADTSSALLGATLLSEPRDDLNTRIALAYRRQERTTKGLGFGADERGIPSFVRSISESETDEWRAEGAGTMAASRIHTLSAGCDLVSQDTLFKPARNADSGAGLPLAAGADKETFNAGVYVQDEAAWSERAKLTTALRADSHTTFGRAYSPKMSLLLRPLEDTTVRLSGGRAYRAPSVLELFQPDVNFGSILFRSNPDLRPEYVTSADASVEQRFGVLRAHGDVFYNEMDDLIGRRTTGNVLTFENVDEAWSAGVEAGLDCSLAEWFPGVTVFANGTRQHTEDRNTGLDLAYMPETMFNAGVLLQRAIRAITWSGSIRENYVGTRGYLDLQSGRWQALEDYWRTDVSVKATHRNGVWIALSAQNVMNTTYREASTLDPAPGRLLYVETGVRF